MRKFEELVRQTIMDRFMGGLINYIENYYRSLWSDSSKVDYVIPNDDYISDNWQKIYFEMVSIKSVRECSEELKEVVIQYLPLFLDEYPEYRDAECLKTEVIE